MGQLTHYKVLALNTYPGMQLWHILFEQVLHVI